MTRDKKQSASDKPRHFYHDKHFPDTISHNPSKGKPNATIKTNINMLDASSSYMNTWVCFLVVVLIFVCGTSDSIQWNETKSSRRRRLTSTKTISLRWSDPKTTTQKIEAIDDGSGISDSTIDALRIVAFGTSKTWGAGLADPKAESYTTLLSPNAVNLGLRATPADYPSFCLHSMIGEQEFDVVILEFSPFRGQQHADFDRLARRVRARFPSAIIIHLPIYMLLYDIVYQRKKRLQDYLISLGIENPNSPGFRSTIQNMADSDLEFPGPAISTSDYRKTLHAIDGYMIDFPYFDRDIKRYVLDHAQYYGTERRPWDFVHPNALGHRVIAQKLRNNLKAILAKRPLPSRPSRGLWIGGKDRCVSWFSGGNVTSAISSISNMDLENFTPENEGKWSLSVNRNGGSLSVECLFPNCQIYVSFMTIAPHREYPRTLLAVNDDAPILVDPHLRGTQYVHLREIAHVGTSKKQGQVRISFKPIPSDINTPERFRVTGIITTPTTAY